MANRASTLPSCPPALPPPPMHQVGLFSLGIIPYINASIVLQLMTAAIPGLKKLQREEGAQVWGGGRMGMGRQ